LLKKKKEKRRENENGLAKDIRAKNKVTFVLIFLLNDNLKCF